MFLRQNPVLSGFFSFPYTIVVGCFISRNLLLDGRSSKNENKTSIISVALNGHGTVHKQRLLPFSSTGLCRIQNLFVDFVDNQGAFSQLKKTSIKRRQPIPIWQCILDRLFLLILIQSLKVFLHVQKYVGIFCSENIFASV